jgi:histone H3/H4
MERFNRRNFAELKGRPADRWRVIRKSNEHTIKEMIGAGHSVNSISKAIGMSRAMVSTCLRDLGIPKPDISEGNRRAAAMLSESQRQARASAAHSAIRKIGRNSIAQANHARRKQITGDYIGAGESDLAEKLNAVGMHPVPQAAFEGYNIDLLCDHLAVEVHNYTTRPTANTQNLARIVKLLCAGLSVIYVKTGPDFPKLASGQ